MTEVREPRPDPARRPHLGMHPGELDGKWHAKYWNPVMAPMPEHIKEAIGLGPQPPPLFVSWLGRPELRTAAADTKDSPVAGPSE
ncbi:hypothetical protein ACFY1B_23600 [Streptomyces mirabilis]|uniref:hypothetical protein n=1 Tax=Streptomyces mirabilis TaxID=68239 RepID=UPI0036956C97